MAYALEAVTAIIRKMDLISHEAECGEFLSVRDWSLHGCIIMGVIQRGGSHKQSELSSFRADFCLRYFVSCRCNAPAHHFQWGSFENKAEQTDIVIAKEGRVSLMGDSSPI